MRRRARAARGGQQRQVVKIKGAGRFRQGAEQDEIAATAGALPVGGSAPWHIEHTVPIDNEHGDLTVLRDIDTPLVDCREILFTVRAEKQAHPFITRLCRQDDHWKWADAEPAVGPRISRRKKLRDRYRCRLTCENVFADCLVYTEQG